MRSSSLPKTTFHYSSSFWRIQQHQRLHNILLLLVLVSFLLTHRHTTNAQLSCDLSLDTTCPSTNDGVCDSNQGSNPLTGCENSDCYDCDQCRTLFDFNCIGCQSTSGCVWCPTDGTCRNSPNYPAVVNGKESSCAVPSDYILDASITEEPAQCTDPTENVFK